MACENSHIPGGACLQSPFALQVAAQCVGGLCDPWRSGECHLPHRPIHSDGLLGNPHDLMDMGLGYIPGVDLTPNWR